MRLWALVDYENLPRYFSTGLDNPGYEEIIFTLDHERLAAWALETPNDQAFIQVDFPDDQLDYWLQECIESVGNDVSDLEDEIEEATLNEEEVPPEAYDTLEAVKNMSGGADNIAIFGYACLFRVLPPEMIMLLDPKTMMEAVYTGKVGVIAEAIETTEAYGLESLGSGFWAWLMFMLVHIVAGRGERSQSTEEREVATASRKAVARRARRRRSGKGRSKKTRTKGTVTS